MEKLKNKYIFIALGALGALLLLYSTYALITDGSPTVKSIREHLNQANGYHKDSLFDKAIEPYQRALESDRSSGVANYNSGTNLLLKNYKDLKAGTGDPETVKGVYSDALAQLQSAASNATDKKLIASSKHNEALVHHLTDSLEKAAGAYKESLRKNPADHETRYNLAVVLYQLKNQQDQNQQQQQEQNQQQQQQQQQEQNQQQEQQQQEQQQQNQDQQDKEQQQQQAQASQSEDDMSKENAERLLEAAMQDEKAVLEKVKREKNRSGKQKLQKNW
ncbi:MAG: aerotolerance regulator BatC [Bacteroidaceae bacterium]|nr:aerotolerance regulator BatC [Bacteroidaceae bacterium]